MSKIMGIDISSRNSGWCVIDGKELIEYNVIHPSSKMSMSQKLNLFNGELEKIISQHKPDNIAIEDVIICRSAKTAIVLGRFNGVALRLAYAHNQKEPSLYVPSEWKKSLLGCDGSSPKAEIQLSICEYFDLIKPDRFDYYIEKVNDAKSILASVDKGELYHLRKCLASEKRKKDSDSTKIKNIERQINKSKKSVEVDLKERKKLMSSELESVSLEIYSETGISDDIADSIGVALKCQSELGELK